MIFGTFFLSGIFGASAFLQADSRGWRFYLAPLLLVAAALCLHFYIMISTGFGPRLSDPVGTLIGTTVAGAVIMLGGLIFGSVAVRWHSPGRVGTLAFVLCLTALWLISFTLI